MPVRIVEANGIKIWCEDRGDPADPPIVLVMGATASALRWHGDFCDDLAERGRYVIRFDNRDVGRSTCFDYATAPYTLSDMANDVMGLMDALSLPSAHLVGRSMGGMIGQIVAIEHPNRIRTLTSIMSSPSGTEAAPGGHESDLPGPMDRAIVEIARLNEAPPATREELIEQTVALFRVLVGSRFPFDEHAERAMVEREMDRARDYTARANHPRAVARERDRRPALAQLTLPTLVIHGTEDPILPLPHGVATAESIPGARLMALEGVGHELPAPTWPQVIDAIAELTAKA